MIFRFNLLQNKITTTETSYPIVPKEMRWGYWTKLKAEEALSHLKQVVFPSLVDLADAKSSFGEYMKTTECKINKASLLIEACNLIDQMQISQQNQDVQGDLYEYLLNKLSAAGRNGQFAGVVARVESLRGRMSEAGRQVEGLFESLLPKAFH